MSNIILGLVWEFRMYLFGDERSYSCIVIHAIPILPFHVCVSLCVVVSSLVTPFFSFLLLLLFGSQYIFIHIVLVVVRITRTGC